MAKLSGRLTRRIEDWVEEALDKHALQDRESVTWDVQFVITQEGPQMAVSMFMPSAILGTHVSTFTLIPNPPIVNEVGVEEMVKQSLEALRDARSESLDLTNEIVLP